MSNSTKLVHRKLNVPLFIGLLICAFLPGIIYGIYCAIPSRVPAKKPKSSGWKLMLICLGIHVLIGLVYVIMAAWIITILLLVFAALIFLMGFLNKDGKSPFLTIMCIWVQLLPLLFEFIELAYLGPVAVAGLILGVGAFIGSIVANQKLTAWDNYRRFGNQEATEQSEQEDAE